MSDTTKDKSVFILCEYGLNVSKVMQLYESGYTLNDLYEIDENSLKFKLGRGSTQFVNKIKQCMNDIPDLRNDSHFSVYALILEGIPKGFVNRIFDVNLSIENILDLTYEELMKKLDTGYKKVDNMVKSTKKLLGIEEADLNTVQLNSPSQLNQVCLDIVEYLKNDLSGANPLYLSSVLNYEESIIDDALDMLEKRHTIIYTSEGIKYHEIVLLEAIDMIMNPQHKEAVLSRCCGFTLEEIGCSLGVTRERARQICVKSYDRFPSIVEDKYKEAYELFKFTEDEFKEIFNESKFTYGYLNSRYKKGKMNPTLENLESYGYLSERYKKIKTSELYFQIDEQLVPKNRRSLLSFVAKRFDGYFSAKELTDKYNSILKEHASEENEFQKLKIEVRYIDGNADGFNVINAFKKGFRYFEITEDFFIELMNKIQLFDYPDTIISTRIVYIQEEGFMKENDIHDEYELHNIIKQGLKKIPQDDGNRIKMLRMPMIQIGDKDPDTFIEEHIYQFSPVNIDEFVDFMAEEYGYRKDSFKSLMSTKRFNQYVFGNEFVVNPPMPTEEQINILKEQLKKDFYLMDDYKQIVRKNHLGDEFFTRQYINQLGYDVNGYEGGIYPLGYRSLMDYFNSLIYKSNTFDLQSHLELRRCPNFTNKIYRDENQLDIFQFKKNMYVSQKCLEQSGFSKSDLEEYRNKIFNMVEDNQYFTIDSLIGLGLDEKFREYEFDDIFYTSLFRGVNNINYITINNYYLFKKTDKSFTKIQFLEDIIYRNGPLDIYRIRDYLKDIYGISMDFYDIEEVYKRSSLYYNDTLEKAYLDYSQFLEEI